MPRELLITLLKNRMIYTATGILTVYFLNYYCLFWLGVNIHSARFELKKYLAPIIGMLLLSFCGRYFIDTGLFGLLISSIFAVSFCVIGKMPIFRSVLTTIFIGMVSGIGTAIIEEPLKAFSQPFLNFWLTNPNAVIIGTLIECLFPAIMILILNRNLSDFLTKEFYNRSDLGTVIFFIIVSGLFYQAVVITPYLYNNLPITMIIQRFVFEITLILAFVFMIRELKRNAAYFDEKEHLKKRISEVEERIKQLENRENDK